MKNFIYLNHASVSPLPRRSAEAMRALAADAMENGSTNYPEWSRAWAGLRTAAARLIGASEAEIALTKNTSEGLAIVANGLDWRAGDVVVGIRDEFPANYFPWLQLEQRGVKPHWLELNQGRVDLEEIDRACRGARLLAISFVQYISGFRVDLDAVGEICRRRDCLLVVDAVQGLGPFPVDVKRSGIHALSNGGHKWLLGPEGTGFLFIDSELMPQVRPVEFGWTNVAGWRTYSREPELEATAARYQCGTLNTIGYAGLRRSVELFLEVGVENIAAQVHALVERIENGAAAKGYELMTPRDRKSGSGIISLRKAGVDSNEAVKMLAANGVSASQRSGWIRCAPHFYETEARMDRVVELLP